MSKTMRRDNKIGCIVALQTGALGKLINVNKKENFC